MCSVKRNIKFSERTFLFVLVMASLNAFGQQQVMFSQYMNNTLAINPAYAGAQESLSMTALMREQWTGIEGAPSTQTLSAHLPIEQKNIGVGMLVYHDEIGVTKQTGIFGSYAYKLKIDQGTLSLGLQGGFTHYTAKYSLLSDADPTFQNGDVSEFHPNFGIGAFYQKEKLYVGVSVPQLIQSKIDKDFSGSKARLKQHFFMHAGYVIGLSHNVKLKPSLLLKFVKGAPLEVDLNANIYFYDVVGLGASWRSGDAIVLLMQLQLTRKLQFGYSYDYGLTALRQVNSGSHEIFINYRLKFGVEKVVGPRYF